MRSKTPLVVALAVALAIVSSARGADDQQWLQYRTADDPQRAGVIVRPAVLDILPKAPEGLALPPGAAAETLFAKWKTPLVKEGFLYLAVVKETQGGPWSLAYIDSNGNGKLGDEKPVKLSPPALSSPQGGPSQFTEGRLVKILFPSSDGGQSTYHLNVYCYDYSGSRQLYVSSAGWYEGAVKVDGAEFFCALIDYDSNGSFNDISEDARASDRIAVGAQRTYAAVPLSRYVQVGDKLYTPKPSPDGASIAFASAGDVKKGVVTVPPGITKLTLAGEAGQISYTITDSRVSVPVGKWRAAGWQFEVKDKVSLPWVLVAADAKSAPQIEVVEGKGSAVDVGEPVIDSLTTSRQGESIYFAEILKGRSGERIQVTAGGKQPPAPSVRITNKDGTYDKTFQFQYG